MASKVKYTPTESGNIILGQAGSQVIAAGATVTPTSGDFVALLVTTAGTVSTTGTEDAYPSYSTVTLPAGVTVFGRWSEVICGTGAVIAYNG